MIDYQTIKDTIINAKKIRDESYVIILEENGQSEFYSKSVYDAALEAAGDDQDLFSLVYMLTLNSNSDAQAWAHRE